MDFQAAAASSSWTRTVAPLCQGAGGGACSFDEFIKFMQTPDMTAQWSGTPPTGITDVTSSADVDKAATAIYQAGYPPNQKFNANAINPTKFPLNKRGKIPTEGTSFGAVFGPLNDVIQEARKLLGDSAIGDALDVSIYAMDNIRTARMGSVATALPDALQAYAKMKGWGFTVAKLPDGTVDWPTTIGSDPNASETNKNEIKALQTASWATTNFGTGKVDRTLKNLKNHAIAVNNCAQFLSDLKGCVPT